MYTLQTRAYGFPIRKYKHITYEKIPKALSVDLERIRSANIGRKKRYIFTKSLRYDRVLIFAKAFDLVRI